MFRLIRRNTSATSAETRYPSWILKAVYQEQLRGFFSNPQEIAAYLNQTATVINEKKPLIQVLEQEQAGLKKDLEKLYDLYFGDDVT